MTPKARTNNNGRKASHPDTGSFSASAEEIRRSYESQPLLFKFHELLETVGTDEALKIATNYMKWLEVGFHNSQELVTTMSERLKMQEEVIAIQADLIEKMAGELDAIKEIGRSVRNNSTGEANSAN